MALSMKRIVSVLAVAALMAAMLVVTAATAFADHSRGHEQSQELGETIDKCQRSKKGPGISECTYEHSR